MLLGAVLTACHQTTTNEQKETTMTKLELTQEWDKVFPLSEKVSHRKVTFETQYGLTLAADLYTPAGGEKLKVKSEKYPAIAVGSLKRCLPIASRAAWRDSSLSSLS